MVQDNLVPQSHDGYMVICYRLTKLCRINIMRVKFKPDEVNKLKYGDLTENNVYRVVGIEGDLIRLMSDEGLPYLYPLSLFKVVDPNWPNDWVENISENGFRSIYPRGIGGPGFFENYFDGDNNARFKLRLRLQKWRNGGD